MDEQKEKLLNGALEAFLSGDQTRFSLIIKLISFDVINCAYRYTHNLEDAKDVFQDVSFKIYKSLRSFRGKARFSTWIYRITVNTCIDFLRKKKYAAPLNESILKNEASFTERNESKEKVRKLAEGVAQLPRKQKTVFILRHYQGLKIKEISGITRCSQSAVKTHLCRALQKLKKVMEGK